MIPESELVEILSRLLANPRENEVFELKEAKGNFDYKELGKYFSALSNEANLNFEPWAWLVFGVDDSGKVVGTRFRPEEKGLQGLKREIANSTNNGITFMGIYPVEYEGKRVVMFQIPPAAQAIPTQFNGFCYGRHDSELVPLNEEKRERIQLQSRIPDWSAEVVKGASFDDLDAEAILVAREKYAERNPHHKEALASWSDEEFLNKAKVTIRGKITNTALLLLGKAESRHMAVPADAKIRWIVKDKDGVELGYYIATGPYILEVEEVYRRIRNLRYRYKRRDTLFPEEVDMYDADSIYEALDNAIAHQDYLKGERISVVEMPDHLIFHNAGSFLPGSVEDVVMHGVPSSRYRNQFLVEAMRNLGMVDTIGSGILKIFRRQSAKLFPLPDYTLTANSVEVSISGKVLDEDYASILAQNRDLSLSDIMLLDKVSKHQEISKEAAAQLRKRGLIEGRRPNYYLSREVASKTGQKAQYSIDRGLDKEFYLELILKAISDHGEMSRRDIETLLWEKLPASYSSDEKKRRRIEKLIADLRAAGKIYPTRRGRHSYWHLKM